MVQEIMPIARAPPRIKGFGNLVLSPSDEGDEIDSNIIYFKQNDHEKRESNFELLQIKR